jgi:hypothetical protein
MAGWAGRQRCAAMGGAVGGGSTGDAPQMRRRCGTGPGRPPCGDMAAGSSISSNGGSAGASNGGGSAEAAMDLTATAPAARRDAPPKQGVFAGVGDDSGRVNGVMYFSPNRIHRIVSQYKHKQICGVVANACGADAGGPHFESALKR